MSTDGVQKFMTLDFSCMMKAWTLIREGIRMQETASRKCKTERGNDAELIRYQKE